MPSVVVVLPASIWAMMPIFLSFSKVYFLSAILFSCWYKYDALGLATFYQFDGPIDIRDRILTIRHRDGYFLVGLSGNLHNFHIVVLSLAYGRVFQAMC